MNIETWQSNKGQEEIHHFLDVGQNTYVFGINAQLLGYHFYLQLKDQIEKRLQAIKHSPFNFAHETQKEKTETPV